MNATLITKQDINFFTLSVLRQAVKLEALGMKKRGMSATATAKRQFKLPRHLKSIEVLACLDYAIDKSRRKVNED